MITRSNLAEQLREYQKRSKYSWASVSFFSSTSASEWKVITASVMLMTGVLMEFPVVEVVIFVLWELTILAFLVFSVASLYYRRIQLALILVCIAILLLLCLRVTKQVKLNRKRKRRMLLPLSI